MASTGTVAIQIATCVTNYAERLKAFGCLRVRVADRRLLADERQRVNTAAATLQRRAYTSYRYPFLYARLGEKVPVPDVAGVQENPSWAGVSAERV